MTELREAQCLSEFNGNAFANQNMIARDLSGIEGDVFVELPKYQYFVIEDEYAQHEKFTVEITEEAPVWIYYEMDRENKKTGVRANNTYYVNGNMVGEFIDPYTESSHILYVGKPSKGERIDIELISDKYKGTMHVAYFDANIYNQVIDRLSSHQFEIKEHRAGHFKGTIDAGDGGCMLLTLPNMRGWSIKIDGKRVDYESYREALIELKMPKGEHYVDIKFVSSGFYSGVAVGIFSLIMLIVLCKYKFWFKSSCSVA